MSPPTLFGKPATVLGDEHYRWSWEGRLFSARIAEWPGGWGWAAIVQGRSHGNRNWSKSAEGAAADLERFLSDRYQNARQLVHSEPPVAPRRGMHFLGDADWARVPPTLTAEQVAQAAWAIQGRISGLRSNEMTQHHTASFEDACRIAQALPASAVKRVVFSPNRSLVVGGCSQGGRG